MLDNMNNRSEHLVKILMILGAGTVLTLITTRVFFAFSFAEPLHVITSGWEEETLFALWKFVNDIPVYNLRTEVPFSGAAFNWFFYAFYGSFGDLLNKSFAVSDEWLPTFWRLLTLTGSIASTFICYLIFRRLAPNINFYWHISYSVLVGLGPIIGYWAITARPDIWSFFFELLGVLFFIQFIECRKRRYLLIVALFAFIAWSFKQINVSLILSAFIYLVLDKNIRGAILLSVAYWFCVLLVIILGNDNFINSLFYSDYPLNWGVDRMFRNITNVTVKALPVIIPLIYLLFFMLKRKSISPVDFDRKNDADKFIFISAFVSLLIFVPASAQAGASENYYFFPVFAMTAFLFTYFRRQKNSILASELDFKFNIAASMGWAFSTVLIIAVFNGSVGVFDIRNQHTKNAKVIECIQSLNPPIFVFNRYLSLPWIVPDSVPFVRSFAYEVDRDLGTAYEFDGIGGLIDKGAFKTLLLPRTTTQSYDGGSLSAYTLLPKEKCEDYSIFVKSDPEQAPDGNIRQMMDFWISKTNSKKHLD